jgi:ketosteroid isomerase-like protein
MVNGCTAGNSNAEQEVRATLFSFLAAFENGDIEFMEEFFADDALSRRTFVLVYQDGSWKIVHLHASNVLGSD